MANPGSKSSSKNDGMYGMFVGIFEKSKLKEDTIDKQKLFIFKLLHAGVEFLRTGLYKDAKGTFCELKTYMKISDVSMKNNKKYNFKENIPFIALMGYSYSFLMMDEPWDDNELPVVAKDIALLIKEAPKKQIIRFLELLFAFKKGKWAECLYLCEKLQNMPFNEVEESKYDWPHIINNNSILELDKEYCDIQIENIQENSMLGHMEKMIKVEVPQYNSHQAHLMGLKWLKSRNPDLFKTVLKRLRQFKQPMGALDLHKFIHSTVFPKLYHIISADTMPFFFYYREDYLNSCNECMRAQIHSRAGQELIRTLKEAGASCQSEYEDDDDDYIDIDDDDDYYLYEDSDVPPKKRKNMTEAPSSSKSFLNKKATSIPPCDYIKSSITVTQTSTSNSSNKKKPDINSSAAILAYKKESETVSTTIENETKTKKGKINNSSTKPNEVVNTSLKKPVMKEQGVQTTGKNLENLENKSNNVQENANTKSKAVDKSMTTGGVIKTVIKPITTEKVSQTEKIKVYHKFSQTATAVAKVKKNDKLKVNHKYCQTSDKVPFWSDGEVATVRNFGVQVEVLKWSETKTCAVQTDTIIKHDLERCGRCSKTEKIINDELKGLKCLITKKNVATKDDTYMQVLQRLETNQFSIMESLINERQDQFNRNTFLQKLLLDQIYEKYLIYKDIYGRLENKCKFVINNVTALHRYLTRTSVPNLKQNNLYLNRWQKTLTEIQIQSKEVKSFYKTSKNKIMATSNDFEMKEWPKIAEIPIEALAYIFDNLKASNAPQDIELTSVKPIKLSNKTVRIVTPIEELKICVSPIESIESNQSLNKCDKFLEPVLTDKGYQPIPMPPSANTKNIELNQCLNKCDKFLESALADKEYEPIPMPAKNIDLDSSDSTSTDSDITLDTRTPPATPIQDLKDSNSIHQLSPSSNEETTIFQSPTTILPPEFYRNFPPPPLPANFKTINGSSDFQQESDYDTADEYQSQSNNKENITENLIYNQQIYAEKNIFEPKFPKRNQNCFEFYENKQVSVRKEEENPSENGDNFCEIEPENESSGSLDSYVEIQRKNKPKLKNVDENGREIQEQKKDNDQEIFSFLQKQCSDVPEQDLINAILQVMRNLGDAFEQLPKQEILKQVKIALPSRTPWKSTSLLFPDWKSDKADTECSICFEHLVDEPLHTLPCRHQFHKDCIKGWLQTNSVCPICRVHSVCNENFPPLK